VRDECGCLVSVDGDSVHNAIVAAGGVGAIGTSAEARSENYRGLSRGTLTTVTSHGSTERELIADAVVVGRPFTDPGRTADDVRTLGMLADLLAERAADTSRSDGWRRWRDGVAESLLLVPSWERLETAESPAGVGFFGQLRPDPEGPFPPRLERAVADAGARAGWLLAYLNTRFLEPAADGARRYGNLVVISSREEARALAEYADHAEAVRRSAGTYRSIRIHRLALDGIATRRPAFRVNETLYLDFGDAPPWRAVRTGS
jgi:hypothetical protein